MSLNYGQLVNKIYNQFLSRNADPSGSQTYTSLLLSRKITLKDFIITITESDEYKEKSKMNLNKAFKQYLGRSISNLEYNSYFEILKRNGNRIEVIENIIKNSQEYKKKRDESLVRKKQKNKKEKQIQTKQMMETKALVAAEKKQVDQNMDKIQTLFKDILEREADTETLYKYLDKIKNNKITFEDIEYELLNSEECSKLIDKKINNWINKINEEDA